MLTTQETVGMWSSIFGDILGEQSSAYQAMFALEKGFAVARALMNVPSAYSKAYDAVVGTPYVGPYIAPVVGAAAAAAQVVQASQIKSISLTGMAHDGIDNIPKEGTWLLDGGERVLNPNQNQDLTKYLSDAKSTQAQSQVIDNKVSVLMVEDQRNFTDKLYGPDGEKAYLYHHRRNKSKL